MSLCEWEFTTLATPQVINVDPPLEAMNTAFNGISNTNTPKRYSRLIDCECETHDLYSSQNTLIEMKYTLK